MEVVEEEEEENDDEEEDPVELLKVAQNWNIYKEVPLKLG